MNKPAEEKVIKKPDGKQIYKTLVQLYADQMGVKITYVLNYGGEREIVTTKQQDILTKLQERHPFGWRSYFYNTVHNIDNFLKIWYNIGAKMPTGLNEKAKDNKNVCI